VTKPLESASKGGGRKKDKKAINKIHSARLKEKKKEENKGKRQGRDDETLCNNFRKETAFPGNSTREGPRFRCTPPLHNSQEQHHGFTLLSEEKEKGSCAERSNPPVQKKEKERARVSSENDSDDIH